MRMSERSTRHHHTPRRLAGIEGLRAIAASSILVYHCWLFGTPGSPLGTDGLGALVMAQMAAGVTLFFALSGFLLYRPMAAAVIHGTPLIPVRTYLRNRILRIVPAYWTVLISSAVAGAVVVGYRDGPVLGSLDRVAVEDALLIQNYRPATLGTGIPPAWSLAIEAVFYLSLPLLGLLAFRIARSSDRRVLAALTPALVLLTVGLAGKAPATWLIPPHVLSNFTDGWHSVLDRSFLAQADKFSFGMMLAVLRVQVEAGRFTLPSIRTRMALEAAAIAVMASLLLAAPYWSYSYDVTMTLALSAVVGLVAVPVRGPSRLIGVLESRALVAVGLASYSVFLWNQPVEYWLLAHHLTSPGLAGFGLNLTVLAVVVGLLATATYLAVERPALRLKTRARTGGLGSFTSPHDRTSDSTARA
jgi:peptidoglycan/LPS O-acetylase OafA/YrhL